MDRVALRKEHCVEIGKDASISKMKARQGAMQMVFIIIIIIITGRQTHSWKPWFADTVLAGMTVYVRRVRTDRVALRKEHCVEIGKDASKNKNKVRRGAMQMVCGH